METPPTEFVAPLVATSKGAFSAVAVLLPEEVADYCRAARLRVLVGTINGIPVRRTLRPVGEGRLGLALGQAFLRDLGASAGDLVAVELDLGADPDAVFLPEELHAALDGAGLRGVFDALPTVERRHACMTVECGRDAATRVRRAVAVAAGLQAREG